MQADVQKREVLTRRSFGVLRRQIGKYFSAENFVYLDPINRNYQRELFLRQDGKRVLNCVLVGNVVPRMLEAVNWPAGQYRIWVLSGAQRELLKEIFGFRDIQIGVIPRYTLFPLRQPIRIPQINSPFDLVYSGRFARAKGILHVIEVARILQTDLNLPVNLILCGDFVEMSPHNRPEQPASENSFRLEVFGAIERRPWKKRPKIWRDFGPTSWLKQPYQQPCLINFSQHTHEDFGVSLAQGQSLGWPAVLSAWGAHWDAQLGNEILLSDFDVFCSAKDRLIEARTLAAKFVRQSSELLSLPQAGPPQIEATRPILVETSELLAKCIPVLQKYPGIDCRLGKSFYEFCQTAPGMLFSRQLETTFFSPPH